MGVNEYIGEANRAVKRNPFQKVQAFVPDGGQCSNPFGGLTQTKQQQVHNLDRREVSQETGIRDEIELLPHIADRPIRRASIAGQLNDRFDEWEIVFCNACFSWRRGLWPGEALKQLFQ